MCLRENAAFDQSSISLAPFAVAPCNVKALLFDVTLYFPEQLGLVSHAQRRISGNIAGYRRGSGSSCKTRLHL